MKAWLKAEKSRKGKVRAGSLLDRFPTLDHVYAQGCWLECTNCTASYHFGCLPFQMKTDIIEQHKAERRAKLEDLEKQADDPSANFIVDKSDVPPEKKERRPDLKLSIKCPLCIKPNGCCCMECGNAVGLSDVITTNAKHNSPKNSLSPPVPNGWPCFFLDRLSFFFFLSDCSRVTFSVDSLDFSLASRPQL